VVPPCLDCVVRQRCKCRIWREHHLVSRYVVCDRYLVSPVALLTSVPYCCSPYLTLLLTVAHSVAMTRLRRRADRVVSNSQRESMNSRSRILVCALDAVVDRLGLVERRRTLFVTHRTPSIHGVATISDQRIADRVIPSTQIR